MSKKEKIIEKLKSKPKDFTYIALHKPHPNNILKPYQINEIIKKLKEMEDF